MKILQINAVYGDGSTGKIVADIHNLCLQDGIESYVAYSVSPIPQKNIVNGYRVGGPFGKKLHALLCRLSGKRAYFSSHATRRLLRYMDRLQPDIVHLHNLHGNFIHLNMLLKYLAERDIATVLTLHDCWFYTGGCVYYTPHNCERWLEQCGMCPKKHLEVPSYFGDRTSDVLRDKAMYFSAIPRVTVCGVSNWIASEAQRSFLGEKSVRTIYNGIDFDVFYPEESSLRSRWGVEGKFVVLGPASKWLDPINRDTLRCVAAGLDEDCVLVLFGYLGGYDDTLPSNVKVVGHVSDMHELRCIYSAADVFVNCTREDALSLISVESQACGTPVITYRNTGVQETVDGECGFTVETGDGDALLERIRQVKAIGKAALSDQCRAFVKEKFDRDRNYRQFIDLYREICQEN